MSRLNYWKILLSLVFIGTSYYFSLEKGKTDSADKTTPIKTKNLSTELKKNSTSQHSSATSSKSEKKARVNYYSRLTKNISNKIPITVINNTTYKKSKVSLSGEDIFKKIKNDLNNGFINKNDAEMKFKEVMGNYYRLNVNIDFSSSQKAIKLDLLDFKSFYRFSSLKEAFRYYEKAER